MRYSFICGMRGVVPSGLGRSDQAQQKESPDSQPQQHQPHWEYDEKHKHQGHDYQGHGYHEHEYAKETGCERQNQHTWETRARIRIVRIQQIKIP